MRIGQRCIAAVVVLAGAAVLSGCEQSEPEPAAAPSSSADDAPAAEPAPEPDLEPYVVGTVAGSPAGPTVWLDGAVSLADLATDPFGEDARIFDADLEPVDLSPVDEPVASFPITAGALVQGDAGGTYGWHAVQDGRVTFRIPSSPDSPPPVVGYRYAVLPQGTNSCGGTVWDLRAGVPTDVVLSADQCLIAIWDHYGVLQEETHGMPEFSVDLLTGEVVKTPSAHNLEGPLSYAYDGTTWTSSVDPEDVAVGYGRVVYRLGDDIVLLDSRDGSELDRWSSAGGLQRTDCLLMGMLAEDRVLFACGDEPFGAGAETVVVGYRPVGASDA